MVMVVEVKMAQTHPRDLQAPKSMTPSPQMAFKLFHSYGRNLFVHILACIYVHAHTHTHTHTHTQTV